MSDKAKGRRLLISVSPEDDRLLKRAAKLELLPVATYIRRAAVLAAMAKVRKAGSES